MCSSGRGSTFFFFPSKGGSRVACKVLCEYQGESD